MRGVFESSEAVEPKDLPTGQTLQHFAAYHNHTIQSIE